MGATSTSPSRYAGASRLPYPPAGRRTPTTHHRARTSARPGQIWLPVAGRTQFPLWDALTIAYHESTPGHHLQLAQTMYLAESLTRFQRLGVLDRRPWRGLGAVRRAVDARARLLRRPGVRARLPGRPGAARRSCDPRHRLALLRCGFPPTRASIRARCGGQSSVCRSSSSEPATRPSTCRRRSTATSALPGQAISYKVGERVWLDGRERARRRMGDSFDLKEFHRVVLDWGRDGSRPTP